MSLKNFNSLPPIEAKSALYRCCASTQWAEQMASKMPYATEQALFQTANEVWNGCSLTDYLEAFSHHPRIGGNLAALREKFNATKDWAAGEQKGVESASEATLQALSAGNEAYERKFGFVFLICATGKSAQEMLDSLTLRLPNTKETEIENAKIEQSKITEIRIKKLLQEKL